MGAGAGRGAPATVAIGGGHGLSTALGALLRLDLQPTAVVTVADDGGSSGRLRRDLGIIAPGDLRMALLALAGNRRLADVLAHRFARGELEGHALGNLLLVALAERAGGDFLSALDAAGGLLECRGRVLPATTEPVQLRARVAGRNVDGQVNVATTEGHVERLWLEPADPPACTAAVEAIAGADVVLLGPGSLFTSIIVTLLVPGLVTALTRSRARKVYVANLREQVGETSGMDGQAHVDALLANVPGLELDLVVANEGPAGGGPGRPLAQPRPSPSVHAVVTRPLTRGESGGHDPAALADALQAALADRTPRPEGAGGARP